MRLDFFGLMVKNMNVQIISAKLFIIVNQLIYFSLVFLHFFKSFISPFIKLGKKTIENLNFKIKIY